MRDSCDSVNIYWHKDYVNAKQFHTALLGGKPKPTGKFSWKYELKDTHTWCECVGICHSFWAASETSS